MYVCLIFFGYCWLAAGVLDRAACECGLTTVTAAPHPVTHLPPPAVQPQFRAFSGLCYIIGEISALIFVEFDLQKIMIPFKPYILLNRFRK